MLRLNETGRVGAMILVLAGGVSASSPSKADAARDKEREAAIAWFDAAYAGKCQPTRETAGLIDGPNMPRRYEVHYKPSYASADSPPETAVIYEFFCSAGAYNVQFAYGRFVDDSFEPLPLSVPSLDISYDSQGDTHVNSIKVVGYESYMTATNPEFDAATGTLTSRSHWRGLGDAWSESVWHFQDGGFVLKRYVADASYDGKMDPEITLEY